MTGMGLACAGQFVVDFRKPPSIERFKRLCLSGGGAGVLTTMSVVALLGVIPLGMDPGIRRRVLLLAALAIVTVAAVYFVWCHQAIQHSPSRRTYHPDFAEDDEGNPTRPGDGR